MITRLNNTQFQVYFLPFDIGLSGWFVTLLDWDKFNIDRIGL